MGAQRPQEFLEMKNSYKILGETDFLTVGSECFILILQLILLEKAEKFGVPINCCSYPKSECNFTILKLKIVCKSYICFCICVDLFVCVEA